MEITCKRCQTEYDFDDALVSDRGTTVRCMKCGEQFKVYRPTTEESPEQWVINRRDGRELVFTNLRDLQRAITNLQVGRHDTLTRGSAPPRPLGAIAELESFFLGRLGQVGSPLPPPPSAERWKTDPGLSPREDVPSRTGRTGRPPNDGPAAPPPAELGAIPQAPLPRMASNDLDFHGQTMLDPRTSAAVSSHTAGYAPVADLPPPAPSPLQQQTRAGPHYDSTRYDPAPQRPPAYDAPSYEPPSYDPRINETRISYGPEQDWFGEPRFSNSPRTRSRALRWMVVLILLGMLGVASATIGRKYLAMVIRPAPLPQGSEARVDELLDEGNRALADDDLETAKESFDKASALAERDPRVLVDLARLDAVRADLDWLKVRLLPAGQADTLASAKRQAQLSAQRALKQSDKAAEISPDDPHVASTKIDALRLNGELASARLLVARVESIATQAETAYVLAALDLAEESPSWAAVLDRLKIAAAGEQNLARARSALVYALVRSGDMPQAKGELDKLQAVVSHPYPLLPELKAFVARAPGGAEKIGDLDAGKRAAPLPAGTQVDPHTGEAARGESGAAGGDFRALLAQAAQASAGRQYDRAEQLYRAALVKDPGDTEALSGLGDVARARGNSPGARSYYEQVLAKNPHYLPAITALADIKWDAGDRAGAARLYRELVETMPDSSAAVRAKDRVAQAEASAAARPAKPAKIETTETPETPSPPSDLPPGVDTSDLPGFKR